MDGWNIFPSNLENLDFVQREKSLGISLILNLI